MRVKSRPARRREAMPRISARPDVGRKIVIRILMVVVFPAPLGPMRAKTASRGTARSMPFNTGVRRNFLVGPVIRIGSLISCELLSMFDSGRGLRRDRACSSGREGADDVVDYEPQLARLDDQALEFVVEQVGALSRCGAGRLRHHGAGARTHLEQAFADQMRDR